MAIDTTDQIVQERVKHKLLQIAGATGRGGSPGQLYKPPVTNPGRGEAVYGTEKDGQRFFEFLKAMMIDPANNIRKTGGPLGNDDSYGRGNVPNHPDWSGTNQGMTIAHSPSGTYDEYGRELQIAPYKGGNPSGQQIEVPWMKEKYYKDEHKEREKLHNEKYHPLQIGMNYPPPSELDKWLQIYQRNGGSLRHLDPDLRKLILQRGAMKAKLPANNIRRLQDSGHTTVPDPENPGRLKIIDSLGPQAKGLDLGGGRSLGMPEIRALRGIFQGASEAERNKLIEKYSNRPFKGLV